MKIAVLDAADFLGGAEMFSAEIMGEISGKVEFTLITTGKCRKYLDMIPDSVDVEICEIPRLRPFRPLRLLKTIRKVRKIIRLKKCELLHGNSVRAGIIAAFSGSSWTHFAHDFTLPRSLAFLFRNASIVFSCSDAVRYDMERKGISKTKTVYNGINIRQFASIPKKPFSREKPVISIVGRIDSWKGQDVFLKAAKILAEKCPGAEFRIYGTSSPHDRSTVLFKEKLRQYITQNSLSNVTIPGHRKIENILAQTDILVHASTKPEPFGRVIIEALASGTPVIATNIGGPKEILTGETLEKCLIPPNDPLLLANAIQTILTDKKGRNDYRDAAKKRIRDFDIKEVADQIYKSWKSIIRSSI